jgi:hypothetical protein
MMRKPRRESRQFVGRGGKVARSKRRRNKSKAFRLFLLAALTLLIAGFIARREIPALMKSGIDAVPHRATDGVTPHAHAAGGADLQPAVVSAHDQGGAPVQAEPGAKRQRRGNSVIGSGEEITGSERQQLGELIRERSH